MNILVINSGSSSVKYQLIDMSTERVLTRGMLERIGEAESRLVHRWRDSGGQWQETIRDSAIDGHREAFRLIGSVMQETGAIPAAGLGAIGHRVVHGGERFREPALIDADVVAAIRDMSPLAPLHNPPNLAGIEVCCGPDQRELIQGVQGRTTADMQTIDTFIQAGWDFAAHWTVSEANDYPRLIWDKKPPGSFVQPGCDSSGRTAKKGD